MKDLSQPSINNDVETYTTYGTPNKEVVINDSKLLKQIDDEIERIGTPAMSKYMTVKELNDDRARIKALEWVKSLIEGDV